MSEETRRISELERVNRIQARDLLSLAARIQRLEGMLALATGGGGGGSGNASTAYFCRSPGFAVATGTWPSLVCATGTADVYKDVGGVQTLQASSQTIRWWFKDTGAANKLVYLMPSADGSAWDALLDSCTAV